MAVNIGIMLISKAEQEEMRCEIHQEESVETSLAVIIYTKVQWPFPLAACLCNLKSRVHIFPQTVSRSISESSSCKQNRCVNDLARQNANMELSAFSFELLQNWKPMKDKPVLLERGSSPRLYMQLRALEHSKGSELTSLLRWISPSFEWGATRYDSTLYLASFRGRICSNEKGFFVTLAFHIKIALCHY
jgi:hypothetical protein